MILSNLHLIIPNCFFEMFVLACLDFLTAIWWNIFVSLLDVMAAWEPIKENSNVHLKNFLLLHDTGP